MEYYKIAFRIGKETLQIPSLDFRTMKIDQRTSPVDDLEDFSLCEDPSKMTLLKSVVYSQV